MTDLKQFAANLRKLPDTLQKNLAVAERETQKDSYKTAVLLSLGSKTTKQLAKAGHPYSRRAPNASFNPGKINEQSGLFRSSWVMPPQVIVGRTIITTVINISEHAKYMEGTRFMIPRPIADEVLKRVEPRRQRRIQQVIDRTFRSL